MKRWMKEFEISSFTSNEEEDPHTEDNIAVERSVLVRESNHFRQHFVADGTSRVFSQSHDLDDRNVVDSNTKSNNQNKSGSTTLFYAAFFYLSNPAA